MRNLFNFVSRQNLKLTLGLLALGFAAVASANQQIFTVTGVVSRLDSNHITVDGRVYQFDPANQSLSTYSKQLLGKKVTLMLNGPAESPQTLIISAGPPTY
jgi:hypothetical protein